MRKLLIIIALAITPFLMVWAGFLLTAFSFNAIEVFQGANFWGASCIYWIVMLCMIGLINEIINETKPLNSHIKIN